MDGRLAGRQNSGGIRCFIIGLGRQGWSSLSMMCASIMERLRVGILRNESYRPTNTRRTTIALARNGMTLCTCPWKRCRFVNGKQAKARVKSGLHEKHSVLGERTPNTWLCKAVVLSGSRALRAAWRRSFLLDCFHRTILEVSLSVLSVLGCTSATHNTAPASTITPVGLKFLSWSESSVASAETCVLDIDYLSIFTKSPNSFARCLDVYLCAKEWRTC